MSNTLISKANGNFTTSTTWALVDSASYSDSELANTTLTGSDVYSSTFTPAASTVDGVAVKINFIQGTGGSVTVALVKNSDNSVLGTSTINLADIDNTAVNQAVNRGWYFFKFSGGSVVLDGATVCKVDAKTIGTTSTIRLYSTALTNWSRMLRTTATQAPASGDQLHVIGEFQGRLVNTTNVANSVVTLVSGPNFSLGWTGTIRINGTDRIISAVNSTTQLTITTNAGALSSVPLTLSSQTTDPTLLVNSFTVTMDNTATTSFGPTVSGGPPQGMTIGKGGTMTFGTTGGINYYLKWKGTFGIFGAGTLNVGTVSIPIPSTSTAVLEMDSAANVDSSLAVAEGGTVNIYGTKGFTASPSNHYSLMTVSRGGYCTTSGANVTAVSGQAQSFVGLSGAIVINGVSLTILSVTDATHLTLTTSPATNTTPVKWAHAGTAATVTVGDTTGWAISDTVIVCSTSQTAGDSESATILSVDSSTQITLSAALANQHLGQSPTQAEVANITRNVKIRGISTSLQGCVTVSPDGTSNGGTASFTARYAEFYQLGSATAQKRGIDSSVVTQGSHTGTFDVQFCSIHDFIVASSIGINTVGNTTTTSGPATTVSHNVFYNISLTSFGNAAIGGAQTLSDNIAIFPTGSTVTHFSFGDIGGTFTNNVAVGGSTGFLLSETNTLGTFSGNSAHAAGSQNLNMGPLYNGGTISSFTSWRSVRGALIAGQINALTFSNCTFFGNSSFNVQLNTGVIGITFDTCTLCADSVFTIPQDLQVGSIMLPVIFQNCTFGSTSGVFAKSNSTLGIGLAATTGFFAGQLLLIDCVFNFLNSELNTSLSSFLTLFHPTAPAQIGFQRYNQIAGSHKSYLVGGTVATDTAVFHTSSPSARLTPISASVKLATAIPGHGFKSKVANGTTFTVNAWVRKSVVGDPSGAAYNGNQPRLFVRKNVALGISADTLLTTATSANGTWELLSAITPAVTDDGVLEFYVDCDGTTGWANVGSFYTSQSADPGNLQYWLNGSPVNTDTPLGGSATYIA